MHLPSSEHLLIPQNHLPSGDDLANYYQAAGLSTESTKAAVEATWWAEADDSFGPVLKGMKFTDIPVVGSHSVDVLVDSEPTDQGFTILELGEPQDPEIIELATNTLQLIDQFSGGLLANAKLRTTLALVEGVHMGVNPIGSGQVAGLALPSAVIINVSGIRNWEHVTQANYHETVATVLVHEILGHVTEYALGMQPGDYFKQHFEYDDFGPGETIPRIARSIVAKSADGRESLPVREYSRASPAEDFGTSLDSMVADSMGWADTVATIPRMKSSPDSYRSDLVLTLLQEAAQTAKKHDHTPGFIGSAIVKNAIGFKPLRTLESQITNPTEVIADQLESIVQMNKQLSE